DLSTLQSFGFEVDTQWRVAICKTCKYIVDPVHIVAHISKMHGMDIPDVAKLDSCIGSARLRPHLAVIDRGNEVNNEDLSPDLENGEMPAFKVGSMPINGLPVYNGFRCLVCNRTCTLKQESMRVHISKKHRQAGGRYSTACVQVFYGRSSECQQLRYIHVSDGTTTNQRTCDIQELGIPEQLDDVVGHEIPVAVRNLR
ncbi:hypothetical protein V1525DRAFT_351449, partial [Lipomyces kononenkoae]